jgi:uncharacterized protein YecT (DUF1311 family)
MYSGAIMLRYILLICVLQGIADSAIAQSKNKDPMSWKEILDRAGPPATTETPAPAIILPTLTGRVVDEANLIDNTARLSLTNKLVYLETKTSEQLVVVTLNSLQGTSIEDFGLRLGRYWQIGQKNKNNGVLLIVAPNERKVRIEVGYGLEDTLTNSIAKRIINNTIIPRFQTSDFVGGLSNGVDAIINILMNNSLDASISSVGQNHGPSFDCKSAKHPNEKLICQSTELSELDQKINAVYDDVTNLLNNRDRKELRQHQNEWVKERNDCGSDFLCTKFAYTKRIDRLNSLLLKLREAGATKATGNACCVADPEPPLNVRTTPNGSIVASLTNGTLVTILDYSENKSWVFIGRAEDRSPIGWVFAEYVDCTVGSKTGKSTNYYCYLARQFPETQDKDPFMVKERFVLRLPAH